jgi:hypothetical protein
MIDQAKRPGSRPANGRRCTPLRDDVSMYREVCFQASGRRRRLTHRSVPLDVEHHSSRLAPGAARSGTRWMRDPRERGGGPSDGRINGAGERAARQVAGCRVGRRRRAAAGTLRHSPGAWRGETECRRRSAGGSGARPEAQGESNRSSGTRNRVCDSEPPVTQVASRSPTGREPQPIDRTRQSSIPLRASSRSRGGNIPHAHRKPTASRRLRASRPRSGARAH